MWKKSRCFNRQMNKQIVLHPYKAVLFRNKEKRDQATKKDMKEH